MNNQQSAINLTESARSDQPLAKIRALIIFYEIDNYYISSFFLQIKYGKTQ
ncbi:hypothetical protein Sta7437_0718 [Stanieria cyanosphaera PCC 7437]|uniref:Uncharacterized protein n=1 Tax=Stanieria cyanosphaera (strain ATCC 29371 / PCC 7437) TaxID=111780 RepID=K9XRK5_STAC7|nr:hypothetical protein [Stanieria cyanosphaera]AFZ34312.1 hypothetical protein Sta7437_0718 [Stanieria cyanosphaera PCC 7437]